MSQKRPQRRWFFTLLLPAPYSNIAPAHLGCVALAVALCLAAVLPGCARTTQQTPQNSGSDSRAAQFQQEWLPRMITDARENFNPESVARDFSRLVLDPSRLVVLEPTNVRVYFVASQGGYESALGYWLEGAEVKDTGPFIIFPNASSPKKLFELADTVKNGWRTYGDRRENAPVLPGDFIDLGVLPAGTQIVFFLDANAALAFKGRFTTITDRNPDKVQHVVTVAYQDSPYLLLAFEDLMGGGDRTYNDVVFTVELSKSSIEALGNEKKQKEVDALLQAMARRKIIRARITAGSAIAIVTGGPFLVWAFVRYMRRRRIKRAFARAQELLETGNPREALQMIRLGNRYDGSGTMGRQWADIECKTCVQASDGAQLLDLFERHPDTVLCDETASLMTARTQVETGRYETFHTLRGAWQEKETTPWRWLAYESDLLVKQDRPRDAETLLRQKEFKGPHDAARLARLAELSLEQSPEEAQRALARALQAAPNDPDVGRSQARILERAGRCNEADAAWRKVIQHAGNDPFYRDHYAEFLVRQRDYAGALACWRESLTAPTADTLWLKTIFWNRVAGHTEIAWPLADLPAGPLKPLLLRLIQMPPGRFWHPEKLDPLEQQHPEAFAHLECLWLRALQALADGREETVLALLSACPPDARRYFDMLENALRQILTYRRVQFLNPRCVILGPHAPKAWAVPLFQQIDAWNRGDLPDAAFTLAEKLSEKTAFADIFESVGWQRTAEILRKHRSES